MIQNISNIHYIRDTRTMLNGNVISWKNNYYQILEKDKSIKQIFKGTEIEVYQNILANVIQVKYYNVFYETIQIEAHEQDPVKENKWK